MRILVLSDVPPGVVGGAETQALQLAQAWAASGHEVTVAGHANRPAQDGRLQILRLPTLRRSRMLRGLTYFSAVFHLMWRRRKHYDVVYCRFLKEQAVAACLTRALLRLGQPIIACPAAAGPQGDVSYLTRLPCAPMLTGLLNRHIACINAISREIEAEIRASSLLPPLISAIPNGVRLSSSWAKGSASSQPLRAVFVGRLTQQKGLDLLIDALERIVRQGCAAELLILGEGSLRQSLEVQARAAGVGHLVRFTGLVPPREVETHLRASDLFVLPSRYEGMSGALLEASANGLPAVVTDVSGSAEIVVPGTGWVVPPDDPEALAVALKHALDTGRAGLRRMGMAARQHVEGHFGLQTVAERYLVLFETLLTSDAGRSLETGPEDKSQTRATPSGHRP